LPRGKAAEKAARAAERKRLRNKSVRSATKTYVARAERLISSKDYESAQEAVLAAISALDRAAKKGVIHTNAAARYKSHLMKKLNQARPSATAEKKTTDNETT